MRPIGQAAVRSGVNIETIRYYEREGVVPPPARSENGRRLYDDEAIARLRFVRRCRDLGFPLADVRALLDLNFQANACRQVRDLGAKHLTSVRTKIADLRRLEAALKHLLEQCDDASSQCPALQVLFAPEED